MTPVAAEALERGLGAPFDAFSGALAAAGWDVDDVRILRPGGAWRLADESLDESPGAG